VSAAIHPFDKQRHASACASLLAALPEWFGIPEANTACLRGLEQLPSWVALDAENLLGAITLEQCFPASCEIHFLAVHPAHHRRGIGRGLVQRVESEARRRGARWLHVKTLAPSDPDPFYARTREFYAALGYEPLFESKSLWRPGNPAVVLVKALAPSPR
jgi:GNAT superfamily N-acetyltransferase